MNLLVKKFFYCIELRMGVKVLSVVSMIVSLFVIMFCFNFMSDKHEREEDDDPESSRTVMCTITIFLQSISLVTAAILLYAVIKIRKEFTIPWLLIQSVMILYLVFLILYEAVDDIMEKRPFFKELFNHLCFLVLVSYLWLCVYSYYRQLKDDGKLLTRTLSRPANV